MTAYPDSAFVGVLEQARDFPKTQQILVLATTHLEPLENFSPRLLGTLVGKLEAYKPDVIAAENMSPELVAMMEPEGGICTEIVQKFASKRPALASAQKLLGLERLQAKEEAKNLSAKREVETLGLTENVRLILSLIAADDLNNAALTWGHLSAGERQAAANDMAGLAELTTISSALAKLFKSPSG